MTSRVVVLGGGFAGIRAALDLSKDGNLKVTLINNVGYHSYIPDLYELSTAKVKEDTRKNFSEVFNSVNIPLKEIFNKKDVQIIVDLVSAIDFQNSKISTANSGKISYDFLVIALGSETSYFGIEGAWENSHPLKTTEDGLNIRDDLEERASLAKGERRKLEVIVAGGGFTGVELAAQIKTKFKNRSKITILEAAEFVLGGMPKWAQEKALERLKILGIQVKLNEKILKVTKNKVVCKSKQYPFDYLIWTTGVKGIALRGALKGVELNKKSQLVVTEKLNLTSHPKVFVCGDFAQVTDPKKQSFVPPAAWAAIGEGKIVAQNIKKNIQGKRLSTYIPPSSAFVVPLGGNFAVSNAFSLHWVGFSPWFIKQFIALRYFLSILPLFKAIKVWWRGAKI